MLKGLANYKLHSSDQVRAGFVIGDSVHPLGPLLGLGDDVSLQKIYEDWARLESTLEKDFNTPRAGLALRDVTLLPPSLEPSALYFAGFNYSDHVANMYKILNHTPDPDPKTVGLKPWHNLKPRNALCGSGATVALPTARVDWEVELAVVIGRAARRVSVDDALAYIAGYTIGIDLSARDLAFRPHTSVDSPARMDWIAQKGFEGACPLGPWLVPARWIGDPQALGLKLSVNGEVKQDGNTRDMIFTIAESVSHLSSMVMLSPGDVILTGTPAGTGTERGEVLKSGDIVTASIEAIGTLTVHMV